MVFLSIRVVFCTKCIKFDGFRPFRSVKFQGCYPCSDRFCPASLPIIMCLFIICLCAIGNFLNFPIIENRLRLGIFSRLTRSLATIYIFARVHIIGALVPFV